MLLTDRPSETITPISASPVPPESRLTMPVQNLWRWKGAPIQSIDGARTSRVRWTRFFVFGGALLLSAYGVHEMVGVVQAGGIVGLEWPLVFLFGITFSWIAFAATSGVAGFIEGLRTRKIPKPELRPLTTVTALAMPVYNENPTRTFGALEAMAEELIALGAGANFEIFILSDTTDSTVWVEEELAYARLRQRLAGRMHVWYRRRYRNVARKAGNIADFVTRWGGRFPHMLVLDADSLMEGRTLAMLAQLMEEDPRSGIIQSLPGIVNRNTLFARLQQFAGRVYGPVIARGLGAWHGRDGNYWGHNAIIRTRAFAEACGLPDMRGRKPFGGHIMSHDFVEAALIRRAGWGVYMVPWLGGSFEESPPSLLDVATRDRRWAQGNLQHIPIIFTRGLAWPSRVHFTTGVMSYLASPIWLLLLLTGLALALQARFFRPEYFTKDFSLFPAWPRFDSERALVLFLTTMAVLLLPKILGTVETMLDRETAKQCGGRWAIFASMVLETVLSAFIAPVMMILQSRHVLEILSGRDSGWNAQRRDDGGIPLSEVIRHHWQHAVMGVVMGLAAYAISPSIVAWMAPTLLGLIFAVQISHASGSLKIGLALRRWKLMLIPEETNPPPILAAAATAQEAADSDLPEIEDGLTLVVHDPRIRALHESLLLPPPLRERGKPDLDPVMAEAKIREAVSMDEAMRWLNAKERMAVLSNPTLYAHLDRLLRREEVKPMVAE